MSSVLMNNQPVSMAGIPGKVGPEEITIDVTGRTLEARLEMESVSNTAAFAGISFQPGETKFGPWFTFGGFFEFPSGNTETITATVSNQVLDAQISGGRGNFVRVLMNASGGTWLCNATLLDGVDVIPQTAPVPTVGANAYISVPALLILLPEISPLLDSFAQLSELRQNEVWVDATARIELEVRKLCQPKGSSPVDELQALVWPRNGAFSAAGTEITPEIGWLDSWVKGIAIYADELAEAELLGEEVEEPAEDKGLIEIELDAEQAKYHERWAKDGAAGDFFQPRQKIWSLLAESFPYGGA